MGEACEMESKLLTGFVEASDTASMGGMPTPSAMKVLNLEPLPLTIPVVRQCLSA